MRQYRDVSRGPTNEQPRLLVRIPLEIANLHDFTTFKETVTRWRLRFFIVAHATTKDQHNVAGESKLRQLKVN